MNVERKNRLETGARLALFVTSFLPLFFIMIFRQFYLYSNYLSWQALRESTLLALIRHFGAVIALLLMSVAGVAGIVVLLKNLERRVTNNPEKMKILDIEDKNSDSITYLFTYIIPFIFQDLSSIENLVPVIVLLLVTLCIFMRSSLVMINPTISFWYSIYSVEYEEGNARKKAMILTRERFLEENDVVWVKAIGHRLFYAKAAQEEYNG
jgi:hypothetical protein